MALECGPDPADHDYLLWVVQRMNALKGATVPETIEPPTDDYPSSDTANALVALIVLNPTVYYDPTGKYGNKLGTPPGRHIPLALMVRSFGWETTRLSPDVQRMIERMRELLAQGNDQ